MKFCKDCRHAIQQEGIDYDYWGNAQCKLFPVPERIDLVTGDSRPPDFLFCSEVRESLVKGRCGPEGKLFEPRQSEKKV